MVSVPNLPSEAKIKARVRKILFPQGMQCPNPACRSFQVRYLASEDRYWCKACRSHKFSLTSVHPLLSHMRISWQQLYALLWCWQEKYQPGQVPNHAAVSSATVTLWFDRFRLYLPALSEYPPLTDIVEGDESQLGHKRNRTDQWIAGCVERLNHQNVRLQPIASRDSGNLDRFILKNVSGGALFVTDGYSGYYGLESFHGIVHDVGNHSTGNFGPTAMAENIWSRVDRFLLRVYHQVQKHRVPQMLVELQARFSKPELFIHPFDYLQFALSRVPLT